ncbi:unnamed protein product [Closterium sp. Yama58-4]|nr:unnamed protein product [Closterium sp. Yama58-4]
MALMAATVCPALIVPVSVTATARQHAVCRGPIRSAFLGASPAGSLRHSGAVSFTAPKLRSSRQGSSRVVCGLFGLGVPELLVIGGVALVLFGPKKLPEVGKGLGKTVKGFQDAAKEFQSELKAASSGDDAATTDAAKAAMGGGEYQLSFETFAHDEDVRGIAVISEDCFATSSRDKTVKLWRRAPASTSAGSATSSEFGLDKNPREVTQRLAGHEQQVTGVTATAAGDIATCSVDKTIRVWRDGHCQQQLSGHESSVLCLAAAPNGLLFSGSGDCTIRCWDGSSCIKSVRAHSDSVRGLALLPAVGLLSASHDGSVKLWDLSLQPLLEMVGHTALVYSVASTAGGELIASASEDATARLWKDGECMQVLEHPSCVWAVAFLPNGDLITASADGCFRIWTRDAARVAPEGLRASFEERVKASRKK